MIVWSFMSSGEELSLLAAFLILVVFFLVRFLVRWYFRYVMLLSIRLRSFEKKRYKYEIIEGLR